MPLLLAAMAVCPLAVAMIEGAFQAALVTLIGAAMLFAPAMDALAVRRTRSICAATARHWPAIASTASAGHTADNTASDAWSQPRRARRSSPAASARA